MSRRRSPSWTRCPALHHPHARPAGLFTCGAPPHRAGLPSAARHQITRCGVGPSASRSAATPDGRGETPLPPAAPLSGRREPARQYSPPYLLALSLFHTHLQLTRAPPDRRPAAATRRDLIVVGSVVLLQLTAASACPRLAPGTRPSAAITRVFANAEYGYRLRLAGGAWAGSPRAFTLRRSAHGSRPPRQPQVRRVPSESPPQRRAATVRLLPCPSPASERFSLPRSPHECAAPSCRDNATYPCPRPIPAFPASLRPLSPSGDLSARDHPTFPPSPLSPHRAVAGQLYAVFSPPAAAAVTAVPRACGPAPLARLRRTPALQPSTPSALPSTFWLFCVSLVLL